MKVIDLLNAIAGIGTIPYRIYYNGNIYEYDAETQNYYKPLNFTKDWLIGEDITALLNDEVEIIKEPNKIEKIARCDDVKMTHYGELYKPTENQEILRIKINEIIDEINNLKEKKDE